MRDTIVKLALMAFICLILIVFGMGYGNYAALIGRNAFESGPVVWALHIPIEGLVGFLLFGNVAVAAVGTVSLSLMCVALIKRWQIPTRGFWLVMLTSYVVGLALGVLSAMMGVTRPII